MIHLCVVSSLHSNLSKTSLLGFLSKLQETKCQNNLDGNNVYSLSVESDSFDEQDNLEAVQKDNHSKYVDVSDNIADHFSELEKYSNLFFDLRATNKGVSDFVIRKHSEQAFYTEFSKDVWVFYLVNPSEINNIAKLLHSCYFCDGESGRLTRHNKMRALLIHFWLTKLILLYTPNIISQLAKKVYYWGRKRNA